MKLRALLFISAAALLGSTACSRTSILLCGNPGDLPCPEGFVCVANRCTPNPTPQTCATGEIRCGTACVKLNSDPANCGGCGRVCEAGKVCNSGTCSTSCSGGLVNCSGACLDLNNDHETAPGAGHRARRSRSAPRPPAPATTRCSGAPTGPAPTSRAT